MVQSTVHVMNVNDRDQKQQLSETLRKRLRQAKFGVPLLAQIVTIHLGDKFGESLGGSQAPPSFWEVPGLPRKFPELPGSFSATSPEVLSLWN